MYTGLIPVSPFTLWLFSPGTETSCKGHQQDRRFEDNILSIKKNFVPEEQYKRPEKNFIWTQTQFDRTSWKGIIFWIQKVYWHKTQHGNHEEKRFENVNVRKQRKLNRYNWQFFVQSSNNTINSYNWRLYDVQQLSAWQSWSLFNLRHHFQHSIFMSITMWTKSIYAYSIKLVKPCRLIKLKLNI